uniref:Uncharacterized protein n=1 Tax=Cacopsylla melanoneura TaxID=428564 RepID=A0A8D8UBN0_9HEMI
MASSPISRADIKHLNKPELDHEIKIRGQEPLGKNCNKRKQLLILLQREQRGSITQAMDAIVVTPIEAREVAELVTITVQKLKSENERDLCRRHSRYSARLNHYAHRVTRWTETDPEVKVYKDQISHYYQTNNQNYRPNNTANQQVSFASQQENPTGFTPGNSKKKNKRAKKNQAKFQQLGNERDQLWNVKA